MALTRGKQLVELAFKNFSFNKDVNNNFTNANTNLQSSEQRTEKSFRDLYENASGSNDKPRSDTPTAKLSFTVDNNTEANLDDSYLQDPTEHAEEQFYDYDDSLNDPDFQPEDEKSGASSSENEMCIEHEEVVEAVSETEDGKRSNGENKWQKNEAKRLQMEGKKYKGMAKVDGKWGYYIDRAEQILGPRNCSKRCQSSGVKKCSSITDDDRKEIFTKFWKSMTWDEQKVYVNSLVGLTGVSEKTVGESSRRSRSYKYFLSQNDERICVCKNLFLSTLGIGEQTVYGWAETPDHGIPKKRSSSEEQKWAQSERHGEIRGSARTFFESLPKLESHYCLSSTSKLYLEPVFDSFHALYQEYKKQCASDKIAGKKLFSDVFSSMNLSLFLPKKDLCDICCSFEAGNVSVETHNDHQDKKVQSREEKDCDKTKAQETNSVGVVTMDVQSVILSTKLNARA